MSEYRCIDDVIKEIRGYIADYEAKIEAWEAVSIKTKKDGTEYSELSNRCVEGARIKDKTYTSGKELYVGIWSGHKYIDDEINICGFCDELPDDDERKIPNDGFMRTMYTLTPSEMRDSIARRIELYKRYRLEQLSTLDWLETNKADIEAKMHAFEQTLFEGAPDDRHIKYAFADILSYGIKYGFR
jgi:hypothetical protein